MLWCMVLSFIHIENILRVVQNIPGTHVMILKKYSKAHFLLLVIKNQENDEKLKYIKGQKEENKNQIPSFIQNVTFINI